MEKKFFIRRFRNYFIFLMIPTLCAFAITFIVVSKQLDRELDLRAQNTLSNVNTNLDFVVSNVIFQNSQLANNSAMMLALKKLIQRDQYISYSDAIYLRNIRAMLISITESFSYIESVYLYLDNYANYFSSEGGVVKLSPNEDYAWFYHYKSMDQQSRNSVQMRNVESNDNKIQYLTIYQRMVLLKGVIVMNIDVKKYGRLLDEILNPDKETILFYDNSKKFLFDWNEQRDLDVTNFSLKDIDFENDQNQWININGKKYLFHGEYNESYQLYLVSVISYSAKTEHLLQTLRIFVLILCINTFALMALAYFNTRRTFKQLHYMISVFHDAESGIYPTEPKTEMKDEYDLIMNNIIYLFLQTIKLNSSLVQKQHEQELAELTALQSQINPHFLFNTLQNVQLEIKKISTVAGPAHKMLDHLGDILKYALSEPMKMITLKEEIEYLKKYISIQQFRFGERFIFYYEIQEELMEIPVFRLLIQPLVENSISHGIRSLDRKGYIKVKVFRRGEFIYFQVIDNGIGMEKEELDKLRQSLLETNVHHNHIGLANVNSRLKLYYGEVSGIKIRSKRGWGSIVEFFIPS